MGGSRPDPYVNLGKFIKRQRELAQLSVRQFADLCGISNPYLSQIERGLRTPSSMILQSLSKGLRMSAETLYAQAGIIDPQDAEESDVVKAVLHDPDHRPGLGQKVWRSRCHGARPVDLSCSNE